jgi:hypothetical protein
VSLRLVGLLAAALVLSGLLVTDHFLAAGGDDGRKSLLEYVSVNQKAVTRSSFAHLSRRYVAGWLRLALDPANPLGFARNDLTLLHAEVPRLGGLLQRELWDGCRLVETLTHKQRKRTREMLKDRLTRATLFRARWTDIRAQVVEAFANNRPTPGRPPPPGWALKDESPTVRTRWYQVLAERMPGMESDIFLESRHKTLIAWLCLERRQDRIRPSLVSDEYGIALDLVDTMTEVDNTWNGVGQLMMQTDPEVLRPLREHAEEDDIPLETLVAEIRGRAEGAGDPPIRR